MKISVGTEASSDSMRLIVTMLDSYKTKYRLLRRAMVISNMLPAFGKRTHVHA